jgi:hypothetical protein
VSATLSLQQASVDARAAIDAVRSELVATEDAGDFDVTSTLDGPYIRTVVIGPAEDAAAVATALGTLAGMAMVLTSDQVIGCRWTDPERWNEEN